MKNKFHQRKMKQKKQLTEILMTGKLLASLITFVKFAALSKLSQLDF